MMTNIDDLLKETRGQSESEPSSGKTEAESRPELELASEKTQAQLQSKMREINRRDLEMEILNRARAQNLGYLSLQNVSIDPDILQLISEHEAASKKVICFYYVPYQELRIATPEPTAPAVTEVRQRLSERHHTPAKIYLISLSSFEEGLKQYQQLPHLRSIVTKVEMTAQDLKKFKGVTSLVDLSKQLADISTSELLNLVIATALALNASDVHIETEEKSVALRYRLDGILQDAASLPAEAYRPTASRIKLLSKLKINVQNKPQDGHFVIAMPDGKVDVRVSTLPTNYGESIVMRILRSDITRLKINDLGLNDYNLTILQKEIKRPNGMLIVTGPTGSGKTTSLYAILGELKTPDVKILTIEDPIEYEIPGINQSQINPQAGYTFAVGLRSLVRQDPDIILVGEMRDEETVEISVNAALTGHLVLSTMHTNDAAGAIPRFLAMGAKPYLLAPALNTIVAQRLVRVLCQACKKEIQLDKEVLVKVDKLIQTLPEKAKQYIPAGKKYFAAQGCQACHGLGYKGRTGIFEIFVMTDKLKDAVMAGEMSSVAMKKLLAEQGMLTLAQDGVLKALRGVTSLEEVFRVVDKE